MKLIFKSGVAMLILSVIFQNAVLAEKKKPEEPAKVYVEFITKHKPITIDGKEVKYYFLKEKVVLKISKPENGAIHKDDDANSIEFDVDLHDGPNTGTAVNPGKVTVWVTVKKGDIEVEPEGQAADTAIVIPRVESTEWLVTHNPVFEKKYAQPKPELIKHAKVMDNKAKILITPMDDKAITVKLYQDSTFIVDAHKMDQQEDGCDVYVLRTDFDENGEADTDTEGQIYVEGKLLADAPEKDYFIKIEIDGNEFVDPIPIKIGPLMTELEFAPKIEKQKKFDPYSDEFDIVMDLPWPNDSGQWYGMEIWYNLEDDILGGFEVGSEQTSAFGIENNKDAPEKEQGDIVDIHYLKMSDDNMKKDSYDVKWEGFNDDLDKRKEEEKIDEIYKDGEEAELPESWAHNQTEKGIGAQSVCSEGKYNMKVELKRKEDEEQIQKYEIKFEVEYEIK